MINHLTTVTAFAPATSANLAVGFDLLGFAVQDLGDQVTLTKRSDSLLNITAIDGAASIPYDIQKNTATVAIQGMLTHLNLQQGFDVSISKKIPLSSGLGGSAASGVAALVALNRFLNSPLTVAQMAPFALLGEEAACGAMHGDNIIPCLFGGMTLIQSLEPLHIVKLPLIPLHVVLIHPHLELSTRDARAALQETISLSLFVKQNAHLAGFISALYESDYQRLAASCVDEVIEPMRAHLIPHFYAVKKAAYEQGALACSISGSGPTLFALAETQDIAQRVAQQMSLPFTENSIDCDVMVTKLSAQGATITYEK